MARAVERFGGRRAFSSTRRIDVIVAVLTGWFHGYAERFIRTVRAECTDRMPCGQSYANRVRAEYIAHYNTARSHQGHDLNLRAPDDPTNAILPVPSHRTRRRPVLGGLIHEYQRAV